MPGVAQPSALRGAVLSPQGRPEDGAHSQPQPTPCYVQHRPLFFSLLTHGKEFIQKIPGLRACRNPYRVSGPIHPATFLGGGGLGGSQKEPWSRTTKSSPPRKLFLLCRCLKSPRIKFYLSKIS